MFCVVLSSLFCDKVCPAYLACKYVFTQLFFHVKCVALINNIIVSIIYYYVRNNITCVVCMPSSHNINFYVHYYIIQKHLTNNKVMLYKIIPIIESLHMNEGVY